MDDPKKVKQKRSCGDCVACCTALAVTALDKPPMQPCKHQVGRGCSIYSERPYECQTFVCGWAHGNIPSKLRPDRTGVVLWIGDTVAGKTVHFQEMSEGGLDRVKPIIREYRSHYPVVCLGIDGRNCMFERMHQPHQGLRFARQP